MLSRCRHIRFTQFLWGMMALYLFNFSVDTADNTITNAPEDLTFNDQESLVEIIVEKVLGYENAISEHDEPDTEEKRGSTQSIDLTIHSINYETKYVFELLVLDDTFPHYLFFLVSEYLQKDTPPPKYMA